MAEEFYDRDFPDLRRLGFSRTSDPAYYNCIAFVVGDFRRKWWPGEYHPKWSTDFWPLPVVEGREESVEAFLQMFATEKFEQCDDSTLEAGFEKIAIYALNNRVRHAALQWSDDTWTEEQIKVDTQSTRTIMTVKTGEVVKLRWPGSTPDKQAWAELETRIVDVR